MRIIKISAKNFVILTFFSLLTVLFMLNEAAGASIKATEEWVAIYDGSASQHDSPAKTVVDSSGNVYVTGTSGSHFATVKYDKAGTELWRVRFAHSSTSTDLAQSIAVDGDGNVYVAGHTSKSSGYQYALVKYNSAGVEQWVQTYDGGGTHALFAMALNVDGGDSQTYIYITGYSGTSTSSATADYATIKYDTAGNELWVARFDAAGSTDIAMALVVDGSGNVYVTGEARYTSPTSQKRYATIKYNSTGVQQWVMTYGGDGTSNHNAKAIGLDSGGNVVVSGTTATIKYNTAGVEQWVTPFVANQANSLATDTLGNTYTTGVGTVKLDSFGAILWSDPFGGRDITVDGDDDIYVTGYVIGDTSEDINNKDFKTVKFGAGGTVLWTMQKDVEGHSDLARSMALYLDGADSKTYIIVTGNSETNLTLNDYDTIKYAALDGAVQWSSKFDGFASSMDTASDLAIDSGGNVYITGSSHSSGSSTSYATIKYDPDGLELWVKSYDSDPAGNGTNRAQAIAVDAGGNVYVTGTVNDAVPGYFCGTIKYDTDGVFQWETIYTNAAHSEACIDIAIFEDSTDGQTYAYVAVAEQTTDENAFAVIKYNSSGGEEWVRTYSFISSDDYRNIPTSLAVDADGNVYLAGSSQTVQRNYAATVVVFDKNGSDLWVGPGYSILNNDSQFDAITVDASGNVYLTGYAMYTYFIGSSQYNGYDLIAARYDSSGTEQWVLRYGDPTTNAFGKAITVDGSGNVYVGGNVPTTVYKYDYALIKLNASGAEQWARYFDGGNQGYDSVTAVAVDSAGTAYITGSSPGAGGYGKYTTIAYDSLGNQLWFERYGGSAQYESDSPVAMAVSDDGNVYLTGRSYGTLSNEDYGTVKYSQALVTSDTVAPLVTAISPADGEIDVAKYPTPSVTFNEPMDPLKILDGAIFSVRDTVTGLNIYGTRSYDEATQTLEFASYEFEYETMYTATLREGATDLAGNPAGSQSWSFTMVPAPDTTPPEFVSATPLHGSTGEPTVPNISATFDEPMAEYSLNSSYHIPEIPVTNDGSFQLVNNSTGLQVYAADSNFVSYDAATMTATLNLSASLEFNTNYTATLIGSQIRDASGNALGGDVSWSFTTGSVGDTTAPFMSSVSPDVDSVNVAVDIVNITAIFNEAMDPDSFSTPEYMELFTVTDTATQTPVNGWLNSVVGDTATFYLGAPLTLDTEYTATIDAAVTDVSGNALGIVYAWKFTTGAGTPSDDTTPPHVASVTPDGSSLAPPTVGLLTVTFNEAMDAATIEGASDGSGTGSPFTLMVTGGAYITGTVAYDPGAKTARFYPDTDLSYDTDYTANMANSVTDVAGNAMVSEYPWGFTTSEDPGVLGCDVDAGILEGCANFDDFSYGTGVLVNTYGISTTGPTSEAARRQVVANNRAYTTDLFTNDNIQSEASAYADATKLRLEARSRDINVTSELDGATAFAATKVDVTGVPPGTLIPMTVTINRSSLGDGYHAELQAYDFDNRPLGTIILRKGFQQLTMMKDLYGDSTDPLNYFKDSGPGSAVMTFELLYPAIPNNGVFLYFASGAKKTSSSQGVMESDCVMTLEFNPPPGVTVTLATGQSVTGEIDTDGDGVADSEELSDGDASVATMDTPTGTGQVEVAVASSSGTGATLSQCESLDDSDISLNQTNKPGDYGFPDGIVSFNVNGLPIGGTAVVTVTFPTAIPAGSKYYKVNADGFYEFLSGAEIAANTVTLTLVDGGQGDHDGIANGVIDDPGGIAVPQPCTAEIWYDGINQSCKTGSDYDQDRDGFDLEVDCDDTDVAINFGETEIWYDGINQSCKDGGDYDQDGDGHDSIAHGGDDCDDTVPSVIESCSEDVIFKNSFE